MLMPLATSLQVEARTFSNPSFGLTARSLSAAGEHSSRGISSCANWHGDSAEVACGRRLRNVFRGPACLSWRGAGCRISSSLGKSWRVTSADVPQHCCVLSLAAYITLNVSHVNRDRCTCIAAQVGVYLATFAGTGEIEQNYSQLQLFNSGRKHNTSAAHLKLRAQSSMC